MALGIASDPVPDCVVHSLRTAWTQKIAGIRFGTAAAPACGNGEPASPDIKICVAAARACFGHCQSDATALGLHIRRRKTERPRFADRGGYIAQHAFQRRSTKPTRS